MAWIKATLVGVLSAAVALPLAIMIEVFLQSLRVAAISSSGSGGIGAVSVAIGPPSFIVAIAVGVVAGWWFLRRSQRRALLR